MRDKSLKTLFLPLRKLAWWCQDAAKHTVNKAHDFITSWLPFHAPWTQSFPPTTPNLTTNCSKSRLERRIKHFLVWCPYQQDGIICLCPKKKRNPFYDDTAWFWLFGLKQCSGGFISWVIFTLWKTQPFSSWIFVTVSQSLFFFLISFFSVLNPKYVTLPKILVIRDIS